MQVVELYDIVYHIFIYIAQYGHCVVSDYALANDLIQFIVIIIMTTIIQQLKLVLSNDTVSVAKYLSLKLFDHIHCLVCIRT